MTHVRDGRKFHFLMAVSKSNANVFAGVAAVAITAVAIATPTMASRPNEMTNGILDKAKVISDSTYLEKPTLPVTGKVTTSFSMENSKATDHLNGQKYDKQEAIKAVERTSNSDTQLSKDGSNEAKTHPVKTNEDFHRQNTLRRPGETYTEGSSLNLAPSINDEDSHIFIIFIVGMLLSALGYAIFHNKRKILALMIEGRSSHVEERRGGGGINYKRINMSDACNHEETVSVA